MALTNLAVFKQLDRLRVRVRAARGHRPGETPVPRSVQAWGIEFEAYKEYAPGDDFRYMDWNATGRLDQLLIKRFTAEHEIPFHLFLDTSASMGAPVVDQKFDYATNIIAALSYIVLTNSDTLRVVALTAGEKAAVPFVATPFLRHRSRFQRVQPFLATLTPNGRTTLKESLRAYSEQTKEPGVAIVVSDLLAEPAHYEAALRFLTARGYEVKVLHILGAAEIAPEKLFRRGKLYDVEDQDERWITLTPEALRRYREALQSHLDSVQNFCHRHHILYARTSTATSLEKLLSEELTRAGLLAFR